MGVKLQSSSGGSVEIAAPVTASNYTLTAPTTSSTIDTLARTGNVLQVVQATNTTQVATTSTSYSSTGTTATITPSSSTSKILVLFSQQVFCTIAGTTTRLNLYRNAGSIRTYEYPFYTGTSTIMGYVTGQYLDAPATTSATSYTIYFNSVNSVNVVANYTDAGGSPVSIITLMEIAG